MLKEGLTHFKSLLYILIFFILWEVFCRILDVPVFFLPPPSLVIQTGIDKISLLVIHTKAFLIEAFVSTVLSVIVGFLLALLAYSKRAVGGFLDSLILFLQSIPRLAWAPIIITLMGFGLGPKIFFATFVGFLPIYFGTVKGFRNVDSNITDIGRVYNISEPRLFWNITFPASLPDLFGGLKIAVPAVMAGVVVGEWMVGDTGLGYLVFSTINMFDIPLAYAAILLLSMISIIFYRTVCILERHFVKGVSV